MQRVQDTYRLYVRLGDTDNDELEDILVIARGSLEVDIKQYDYETIILSVPARLVHTGVEDGRLKSEVKDILDELRVDEPTEGTDDSEEETDPRWDELKKLLTDK